MAFVASWLMALAGCPAALPLVSPHCHPLPCEKLNALVVLVHSRGIGYLAPSLEVVDETREGYGLLEPDTKVVLIGNYTLTFPPLVVSHTLLKASCDTARLAYLRPQFLLYGACDIQSLLRRFRFAHNGYSIGGVRCRRILCRRRSNCRVDGQTALQGFELGLVLR